MNRSLRTIDAQTLHLLQNALDLPVQSPIRIVVPDVIIEIPLNARKLVVTLIGKCELTADHSFERWVQVGYRFGVSSGYSFSVVRLTGVMHTSGNVAYEKCCHSRIRRSHRRGSSVMSCSFKILYMSRASSCSACACTTCQLF